MTPKDKNESGPKDSDSRVFSVKMSLDPLEPAVEPTPPKPVPEWTPPPPAGLLG